MIKVLVRSSATTCCKTTSLGAAILDLPPDLRLSLPRTVKTSPSLDASGLRLRTAS